MFCTLAAAGQSAVRRALQSSGCVCLVDEAAQTLEPELACVLATLPARLVLVGDPAQLPALTHSAEARRRGWGDSAMRRLWARAPVRHLLDEQYRMHPAIALFPNAAFYGGQLQSAEGLDSRHTHDPCGLWGRQERLPRWAEPGFAFLDCRGAGADMREQTDRARSVFNGFECLCVLRVLRLLRRRLGERLEAEAVVITFYAAQAARLREVLRFAGLTGVRVCSVDSFQVSADCLSRHAASCRLMSVAGVRGRRGVAVFRAVERWRALGLLDRLPPAERRSDSRALTAGLCGRRALPLPGGRPSRSRAWRPRGAAHQVLPVGAAREREAEASTVRLAQRRGAYSGEAKTISEQTLLNSNLSYI